MRRRFLIPAAIAALAAPAAAQAATFTVTNGNDSGVGSLRKAISDANAAATDDDIRFDPGVTTVGVTSTLPDLTDQVTIGEPDRDVTIDWNGAGPVLTIANGASNTTTLRRLRFVHGAAPGGLLRDEASGVVLDRIALIDSKAAGLEIGKGLLTPDPQNVQVTGATISGSATDGIDVQNASKNITITGSTVSGSGQNGLRVRTAARAVVVHSTIFFGNTLKPIALEGMANTPVPVLSGLRVGPRQPDGTLPLSGNASISGTLDVYNGNPFGTAAPVFSDGVGVPTGAFSVTPSVEPPPGSVVATTLTSGAGTNEFVLVNVPADTASPNVVAVRAVSTREVRLRMTEPIDGSQVDGNDFSLQMAGKQRSLSSVAVSGDGTEVALTSSTGWLEGEAGYLTITAPGAFTDGVGNAVLNVNRLRVAAGPGDFTPPALTKVSVTPTKFCPGGVKRCRGPRGTVVKFTTSEKGKFEIAAFKGKKQIGNRTFTFDKAGAQSIRFSGKLRAGKLSAGRARLRFTMTDDVGNLSKAVNQSVRVLGRKRHK